MHYVKHLKGKKTKKKQKSNKQKQKTRGSSSQAHTHTSVITNYFFIYITIKIIKAETLALYLNCLETISLVRGMNNSFPPSQSVILIYQQLFKIHFRYNIDVSIIYHYSLMIYQNSFKI